MKSKPKANNSTVASNRSTAAKTPSKSEASLQVGARADVDDTENEDLETLRDVDPITYFGTDFDVHGLVRRLGRQDIRIPNFDPATASGEGLAGFQRKFVWKQNQMERFIESLLLGFPVPGIFLVQQHDRALLVLDGQQRLKTMQKFYADEFPLENVVDRFRELKYSNLDDEQRRTLDNVFIHATIIKYADTLCANDA